MLFFDEVFVSIQGESSEMGKPCIFIRLYGCPFSCSWCDQPQKKGTGKRISISKLVSRCIAYRRTKGVSLVCITGGEPLIYSGDLYPLVYELLDNNFKVSIETSGLMPIEYTPYSRSYRYIMDVKCPSSGMSEKNVYDNLLFLHSKDDVVFVIANRKDYLFMRKTIKTYPTKASIFVSPMFDKKQNPVIGSKLVNWILEDKLDKVRFQIQMHKVLQVR